MNKQINILLVEDSEQIISFFNKVMPKMGYVITNASNYKDAIKQASMIPDLIILDNKLEKDDDGIRICKALRKEKTTKDIPIIFISAYAQPQDIEQGLQAGANEYICKPFRFPDLLKLIQNYTAPGHR